MISKLKIFLAVAFTLFLLCVSAQACICVHDDLEMRGFRGEVFDIYGVETSIKEPVKNATVRLLKETRRGDKLIVEVFTDENGRFDVPKVKAGNYILEVKFDNFETVATRIKIFKSSAQTKDELLIRLEPPSTKCCNGEAKVKKST